jgi:exosome complex RNA-binding protein Rrp42 (RNase PH superfamily)
MAEVARTEQVRASLLRMARPCEIEARLIKQTNQSLVSLVRVRVVVRCKLPLQQPYMSDLKILRIAHDVEQFPRFASFPVFAFQLRYPGLLRE